jgi:hypothetical protein
MNGGILAVANVALRSFRMHARLEARAVATLLALAVFLVLLGLSELGEWIESSSFERSEPGAIARGRSARNSCRHPPEAETNG